MNVAVNCCLAQWATENHPPETPENTPSGPGRPTDRRLQHTCSWFRIITVLFWCWLTSTHICSKNYSTPDTSFVLALLSVQAARFQRAEIILWSSGAGRRAEHAAWKNDMSAMFLEAHCLLIRPTEGSFLVFFSPVCNYWCWLTTLQYVNFPAFPMFSLCCHLFFFFCILIARSYVLIRNKWHKTTSLLMLSSVSLQFWLTLCF